MRQDADFAGPLVINAKKESFVNEGIPFMNSGVVMVTRGPQLVPYWRQIGLFLSPFSIGAWSLLVLAVLTVRYRDNRYAGTRDKTQTKHTHNQ